MSRAIFASIAFLFFGFLYQNAGYISNYGFDETFIKAVEIFVIIILLASVVAFVMGIYDIFIGG